MLQVYKNTYLKRVSSLAKAVKLFELHDRLKLKFDGRKSFIKILEKKT